MTNHKWCLAVLLIFTFAMTGGMARAEDTSPDDIAQWVKELDSDEFATREAAQRKLETAGETAVDAVREAALGESLEAAVRAIDILKKQSRGGDAALKQAATKALQQLADGENAIVAGRATDALKLEAAKTEQPDRNATPFIPLGGRRAIRIEARYAIIAGRSVSIKEVEIEAQEKDRKIKIVESREGHIKMKIVGKEDGMDATKEFEAESAEDLKKRNPEAHKIYEKYSYEKVSKGGRIPVRLRQVPAGPRDAELPEK